MNDYEIRPGKALKVKVSTPNVRLFIGNIPKQLNRVEIKEEFSKVVGKFLKSFLEFLKG